MKSFINWRKKKENIRDKNLLTKKPYVGKGNVTDINKRNFIKKGIFGLAAGVGIAVFSKMANARYIFPDATSQSSAAIKLPVMVQKSADESVTSSTTLQNDDHLFIALVINTNYRFALWLDWDFDSSLGKLTFVGPSGATGQWSTAENNTLSRALAFVEPLSTTATRRTYMLHGQIRTAGTAGNLQFQWAQNSSSGNALTVRTGSWLEILEE